MDLTRHTFFNAWLPALGAALLLCSAGGTARASMRTTQPPLRHMTVNLGDRAALRTGALYVLHQCTACHSIQGDRFSTVAAQLGLSHKDVQIYINRTGRKVHDTIVSSMPPGIMHRFVDITPPDLTVIAKRRGVDWLYTYITSFYLDPSRPTGVNNVAFHNVAMPDVFAALQGLQKPVMKEGWRYGQRAKVAVGVRTVSSGTMTPKQFDGVARDIVSFLYLVAHPHQQERAALGPWILGLFGALVIVSYLLYKTFWRRVLLSEERWWRRNR